MKQLSKLSPGGHPDPLRAPLSVKALPRPRFITILTPFRSPFLIHFERFWRPETPTKYRKAFKKHAKTHRNALSRAFGLDLELWA